MTRLLTGSTATVLSTYMSVEDLRAKDKNLTLMVQADMTAYRAPGEPLQLGLPDK